MPKPDTAAIERVFREEYGRAVAILVRHFKDLDLAEDAVQDAFTRRLRDGRRSGIPPSPAGWIVTTARNRLIDRFRREASPSSLPSRRPVDLRSAIVDARSSWSDGAFTYDRDDAWVGWTRRLDRRRGRAVSAGCRGVRQPRCS